MTGDDSENIPQVDETSLSPVARYVFMAIGFFFVGLGAIGVFLPVLPTTPFLILAVMAFSRSSQKFHDWLYTHRVFGPYIRAWNQHRVIPVQAKFLAVTFMFGGWLIFTFTVATTWLWPALLAAAEIAVAFYILSKPSVAPAETD